MAKKRQKKATVSIKKQKSKKTKSKSIQKTTTVKNKLSRPKDRGIFAAEKFDLNLHPGTKVRGLTVQNKTRKTKIDKVSKKIQSKRIERRWSRKKAIIFFVLTIVVLLIGTSIWLLWGIPLPNQLDSKQVPVSTKLFDRNGKLLYEIYTDSRSTPIDINDLPSFIKDATIAVEDKDFYKHHGVSFSGIFRAAYKNLFKQKLEGGSTLTQQLVKNALLTPERTIKRKAQELVLTLFVETRYSKEEILSMYLNQIPYGSTAYGIGAASELYFGKNAIDLRLSEAALLAGITAAPTKFSPFGARPELAKERQELALSRMVEDGYISQEEADAAKEEQLVFAQPLPLKAPHFSLWVKELLAERYGDKVVEQGGLRVTTTLDLDLQEYAEDVVREELTTLEKYDVGNGAVLVTKPSTGEILTMVGSKDYFADDEDGKVNIIFRLRQPGSSIKPLNYALALKDKKITLATPLADVPTCFGVTGQPAYCPRNYSGNFSGAVQTRFALGSSLNIPAVRVLALNGIENFINFAKDMGITTWQNPENYGLSLTLGGGEVQPIQMAEAFGVFANQGVRVAPIAILKVEDWKGNVLEETNIEDIEDVRVLDPEIAFLISHALYDNNARSPAFGEYSQLRVSGHPEVSVKTGTTNDLRDNWTIGYTQDILALTWVGNNDNSSMSRAVSGVSGASPIWNAIIKESLDKAEAGIYSNGVEHEHPWPNQPESIVGTNVCSTTGKKPDNPDDPGCGVRFEYFLRDSIGAQIESGNTDVFIDKNTQSLADKDVPPEQIEVQNKPYLLDPLGTMICLDCALPSWNSYISYPLNI